MPVIIHTGKALTRREETRLRRYAESIIVKDAGSPERLLDETTLFLHRAAGARCRPRAGGCSSSCTTPTPCCTGKRVLIVDDDVRNVFALTSALEARGMEVRFAENGREALESLDADAGRRPRPDGRHDARDGRLRDDARRSAPMPALRPTCRSSR